MSAILNIEVLKMTATEPFKNKLLALKNEFTKRMEAIDKDSRQTANADWSEQASERENDEVLYSLGTTSEHEINMINHALIRIENNEYFVCEECGADIPISRLELIPFSATCVHCAEKKEHH